MFHPEIKVNLNDPSSSTILKYCAKSKFLLETKNNLLWATFISKVKSVCIVLINISNIRGWWPLKGPTHLNKPAAESSLNRCDLFVDNRW